MRYVALIVAACLVSVGAAGCFSADPRVAELQADLAKWEAKWEATTEKFRSGEITLNEAKEIWAEVETDIKEARGAIDDMRADGMGGGEIAIEIMKTLLNVGLALAGVRAWRGSTTSRYGDVGLRPPVS